MHLDSSSWHWVFFKKLLMRLWYLMAALYSDTLFYSIITDFVLLSYFAQNNWFVNFFLEASKHRNTKHRREKEEKEEEKQKQGRWLCKWGRVYDITFQFCIEWYSYVRL